MGSHQFRPSPWRAPLIALGILTALVLSGGTPLSTEAQDVAGGTVRARFSVDTLPIEPGVVCQDNQYKILIEPGQEVGNVRTHLHAGIEVGAALNKISPSYVEVPASDPVAVFTYDAKNLGQETIAYTAYEKAVLSADAGSGQLQIGEGHLDFEVKDCQYTVTLVYSLPTGPLNITAIMSEVPLHRNNDGTFEADGPFEFQQMVPSPCPNNFTLMTAPTHITGKIDNAKRQLNLEFRYSPGTSTFTVTCPIVGTMSFTNAHDPTILGVTSAHFPLEGGFKAFAPALGGQFMVAVNRTVK